MGRSRKLRAPSPAMTVACISLAVALSGASYAAITLPKNSVGTKQIRNNAVKSNKIAPNQVTGDDVNEATFGVVPNAANAATAQNAANAATAATAVNADKLDGKEATDFAPAAAEPWNEVGDADGPPFESFCGWSNFDSSHNTAAFYKDPYGVVHLKGLVKGPPPPGPCLYQFFFRLPPGYWPARREVHASISADAFTRINIHGLEGGGLPGYVYVSTPYSNEWVSLDGITFRAAG
jgi:hypothetical protein